MKKYILPLLLTCLHIQLCYSQEPTPEQIIARYVKLSGGEKYWNNLKTARFLLSTEAGESDSMAVVINKDSSRRYFIRHYVKNEGNEPVEIITVYNKGLASVTINGKTDTITDPTELDNLRLQSYMLPDIVYTKLGYKMKLEAIERLNNIDYYRIRIESPNGLIKENFYEKEGGLLRMVSYEDGTRSIFTEYVKFKDGLYPKKTIYKAANGAMRFLIMLEIAVDEPIDPAIFK